MTSYLFSSVIRHDLIDKGLSYVSPAPKFDTRIKYTYKLFKV